MRFFKHLSRLIVGGALVLLFFLALQSITPAQDDSFLSSRINRLESENSALRSRINRLETQVSRLNADVGIGYAEPIQEDLSATGTLSSDPMFDRLATLAIELKERINVLEAQVADLQARFPAP